MTPDVEAVRRMASGTNSGSTFCRRSICRNRAGPTMPRRSRPSCGSGRPGGFRCRPIRCSTSPERRAPADCPITSSIRTTSSYRSRRATASPMSKYARLRERCLAEGVLHAGQLYEPLPSAWAELALVHDGDYLHRVRAGALSAAEQRRMGSWSPAMVERSRRSVGATIAAARSALGAAAVHGWGVAVNLAGGTRHASRITARGSASSTTPPSPFASCSARGASSAPQWWIGRAPGQRHRRHLRHRPKRFHPEHSRRQELPVPQGAQRARHRASRSIRRRGRPCRTGDASAAHPPRIRAGTGSVPRRRGSIS